MDDDEMHRFLEQVEVAVRERAEAADAGPAEDAACARAPEAAGKSSKPRARFSVAPRRSIP